MNDKNKFQNKKEIKSILTYRNHNKNLDSIINVDKKFETLTTKSLSINTFSPIESYYSSKVQPKFRNKSVNNYNIITFSKDTFNEKYMNNNIKGQFNFQHIKKVKSQEDFSISKTNFVLLSNKKNENQKNINENDLNKDVKITLNKYILNDLNKTENNLNQMGKQYEIIDDEIPITILDNVNEINNLKIDYPRQNKNINTFNHDNEYSNSQTKSNTIRNSFIQKMKNEDYVNKFNNNKKMKKNIKRELLSEEVKNHYFTSPKKFNEKQKKTFYNVFRKFEMKTKIKLPNFSWITNKKEEEKNLKSILNKKNIKIIRRNNRGKLTKSMNNSVRSFNNIKIIDSKDLYKIQRGQYDINNYSDKNPNKFFLQSEIYYKLTHLKK